MDDLRYLEGLLAAGAGDYFDVLAVHPYPFGLPPGAPTDSNGGLNLSRLTEIEGIMARHGLHERPIWATEFGYSVQLSPFGAAVTPSDRGRYLRDAITLVEERHPAVEIMTLWNLAAGLPPADEKEGYNLVQDSAALSVARGFDSPRSLPPSAPPPVALAADVKVHLGDSELPPPWWPLFGGHSPGIRWQGGVYLSEAPRGRRTLLLETYQFNERANRLSLNGVPLHDGPLPVTDFRSQWLTLRLDIPEGLLRAGWNEITLEIGHILPPFQQHRYIWDDIQIRNVRLES
jgi:hypothetical protein